MEFPVAVGKAVVLPEVVVGCTSLQPLEEAPRSTLMALGMHLAEAEEDHHTTWSSALVGLERSAGEHLSAQGKLRSLVELAGKRW